MFGGLQQQLALLGFAPHFLSKDSVRVFFWENAWTIAALCRYIKFASSSSFGNTLYILAAAVWLRFNPITPIQVLLLNLLYNDSRGCLSMVGVDKSMHAKDF